MCARGSAFTAGGRLNLYNALPQKGDHGMTSSDEKEDATAAAAAEAADWC